MIPFTVISLIGILLIRHFIRLILDPSSKYPLPPGPKPIPVIGNLHQVPKALKWLQFYHWSKKYGPIMHLNMAGQPLIILSTNEAAQDLLSRRSAHYSDRPRMVMAGELVTKGMHLLLRPYDAAYKLHKRMEAPLLHFRASLCYRPTQELEAKQLLFDILGEADDDKAVDFHCQFYRTMASTIYSLLYGYRCNTGLAPELLDAQHHQEVFARTGEVGAYIVDWLPFLNILPPILAPWKREAEDVFKMERKLHVGNMERGLKNLGWNFTKHMSNSAESKGMSVEELAFDVGILGDASLDTSVATLDWFVVAWIVHGSRFVAKAQQILDDVVGQHRLPQFDDRERLAFIDALVNETLRWRPVVVGGVPHLTKKEDTYMGYRIPAGSLVLGNHFAITRDESVFGKDVDVFLPERWLDEAGTLKNLPQTGFGFGRRICTGQHFASNQLFIQIARLLWAFDVQNAVSDTGEDFFVDDMACTEGFTMHPKPFRATFRPRGSWARDVILKECKTHGVDYIQILDQVGRNRGMRMEKPSVP